MIVKPIVQVYSLPELLQVQVTVGRHVTNAFPRHIHNSFSLGVVDHGARIITSGDETVVVPAGEIFMLNPAQPHRCQSRDDTGHSYSVINIEGETLAALAGQITEKPPRLPYFGHIRLDDVPLAYALRRLVLAVKQANTILESQTILLAVIARIVQCHAENPPAAYPMGRQQDAVRRVEDYIQAHYARKLTLDELAAVGCLSPYHFQRVFLKNTGLSPHDYLINLRIRKSLALLRAKEPIAEVSLAVGFCDQSQFARSFKRVMGIPPGQYLGLNLT